MVIYKTNTVMLVTYTVILVTKPSIFRGGNMVILEMYTVMFGTNNGGKYSNIENKYRNILVQKENNAIMFGTNTKILNTSIVIFKTKRVIILTYTYWRQIG